MSGFFLFLLVVFTLWLVFALIVTHMDSKNASKIIRATGFYFPFRFTRRRKK